MSWREPFKERERALEDQFIRRQEAALRADRDELQERSEQVEALARSTGVEDPALLAELLEHSVSAKTAAAFDLLPMVLVAWCDCDPEPIPPAQRDTILEEANLRGLGSDGAGPDFLRSCLAARPAQRLSELWLAYTEARCRCLRSVERHVMQRALLRPARRIARAGRGLLGLGIGTSRKAARILAELERPFRSVT